jgi:hypothetical protein
MRYCGRVPAGVGQRMAGGFGDTSPVAGFLVSGLVAGFLVRGLGGMRVARKLL